MTERYRRWRANPSPLPDYTIVTVSASTRRGRCELHTFMRDGDGWSFVTPPSSRQGGEFLRRWLLARTRQAPVPAAPRPLGDLEWGQGIAGQHLDLGDGLSAQGSTLALVFDALADAGREEIDRDDLKVVLSQLGRAITGLGSLGDPQQRHAATAALYVEVVRRCTKV
jgi:hypothetical protein